jgi:hypothetical protein
LVALVDNIGFVISIPGVVLEPEELGTGIPEILRADMGEEW